MSLFQSSRVASSFFILVCRVYLWQWGRDTTVAYSVLTNSCVLSELELFILYWSIADWQYCDSFRWTVEGLSHTYACTHALPNSSPIQPATEHWAEFRALYGRSLLVIHFKHSSVYICSLGFPGSSVVKNPPVNAGDLGSIPGSGRFPGGGNGNPL